MEKHADVLRFVSLLIARRTLRDETHERERVSLTDMLRQAKTAWHGVTTLQPDWSPQSHSLAFGAEMRREGLELHLITNAFWEAARLRAAGRARSRAVAAMDRYLTRLARTTSCRGRRRRRSAIRAATTWARARSWSCGGVSRTKRTASNGEARRSGCG